MTSGGALEIQQTTEVQQVVVTATGGAFNLTFNGQTTVDLAYNSSSATVQNALNALSSIGGVRGSVLVTKSDTQVGGDTVTTYNIIFQDTLAGADQTQITAGNGLVSLSGTAPGTAVTTVIQGGASITVTGEALTINGSGAVNAPGSTAVVATLLGSGALRSVSGNNGWTGDITIGASNTSIETARESRLSLSGIVAFGNNLNTIKTGTGILEFSGTAVNTITTTAGRLYVNEGEVVLNRTGTGVSLPVNLIVGDGIGGINADRVRYAVDSGTSQTGDVTITVNSSGVFDLAGNTDGINAAITLVVGRNSAGDFLTGGANFALNSLFVSVMSGTTPARRRPPSRAR